MRLLGFEITRRKDALQLSPAPAWRYGAGGEGWFSIIKEPFTGAWQRGYAATRENALTYHAVYSCVTLIASDVAKCRLKLVEKDDNGIWNERDVAAFSPVLRKPNRYQNRIKFFEQWIISKLLHGNTYILKERDERNVVSGLYVLDPSRTRPLVTPDGDVFYQVKQDALSGIEQDEVVIPANEIIHDVMIPLYHPLCGVSPLTASGIAAIQGLTIQRNSTRFFQNGSNPGGILTAPGDIDTEDAKRFKQEWEKDFLGENSGRIAVLGGGLKYEKMTVSPGDAQLIEQLKWSAQTVCSTFLVPAYKVGVGDPPAYNNIEALEQQYYSQCLQKFFECIELCLDEGLGLDRQQGKIYGTEFELDDLLRMDTATLIESEAKAVGGGIKAPDESRKRLGLGPTEGGKTPYLQQQNYSLAALAKRDARPDPFENKTPAAPPAEPTPKAIEFSKVEIKQHLKKKAA